MTTSDKQLRVMIIDDESLGRQKVRRMLKTEPGIEIVGECDGGPDTAAEIIREEPDLIFLDIQMPGRNGFELLQELGQNSPKVVFVTAYDEYALKAFEIHAVDYIMKPFDRERFQKALQKAREDIYRDRKAGLDERLIAMLEHLNNARGYPDRIIVKTGGHVLFVRTDELDYVEAAGNYVRLHVSGKSYLLRETMHEIQQKLNPQQFVRIHRSTLVNIERVKELQPWFGGGHVVILANGTRLNMSRAYRGSFSGTILGKDSSEKVTSATGDD